MNPNGFLKAMEEFPEIMADTSIEDFLKQWIKPRSSHNCSSFQEILYGI